MIRKGQENRAGQLEAPAPSFQKGEVMFRNWMSEIKWAWQRVFRGWDDRVIWGINYYLCEMMPVWLGELKRTAGTNICYFDFDKDGLPIDDEEGVTKARGRQDTNLNLMINGFVAYKKLDSLDYDYSEDDAKERLEKERDVGLDLFREHFASLWF